MIGMIYGRILTYKHSVHKRFEIASCLAMTETFSLAHKCPSVDGQIIHDARALYSLVYDDMRMFSDAGCGTTDTTTAWDGGCQCYRKMVGGQPIAATSDGNQVYTLYPNPNHGSFTLQQLIPDNYPVMIEIWNEVGVNIYRANVYFSGGQYILNNTKFNPGMYFIKIQDTRGSTFNNKFIVR